MIFKPTINLNGIAPQALVDQNMLAISALRSAISLLQPPPRTGATT